MQHKTAYTLILCYYIKKCIVIHIFLIFTVNLIQVNIIKGERMPERFEYMILNLKKTEREGWVIAYLKDHYPRDTYLQAMMDYLGLDGWELVSTTHSNNAENQEEERLYFKRPYNRVSQDAELQRMINEIDVNSNTHFVETSLSGDVEDDQIVLKQKVLTHLYDWLKRHDFEWGEPGSGVLESHYLNRIEDVSDDPLFPESHGKNKVSTRIDIFKESDRLRIHLKRRITGSWLDFSKHEFPYTKEGLSNIRKILIMEHFRLIGNQ